MIRAVRRWKQPDIQNVILDGNPVRGKAHLTIGLGVNSFS